MSQSTKAAGIKVISGGAFKQVLNALAEQYEKASGTRLDLTYRTVGQHLKLIESGQEPFDVAVLTPDAIDGLIKDGKVVAGSRADLARTGVGVVVKAGTPLPDIGSVDAFKRTLMAAKSVAYIDPAAGGSRRHLCWKTVGAARHRCRNQCQGQIDPWRRGRRSHCRRAGRDRRASDQRDPAGQGRRAGRSAAGGDPEFHGLCGRRRHRGQGRRKAANALVKFLAGPHAVPIIKAKGMEPASRP